MANRQGSGHPASSVGFGFCMHVARALQIVVAVLAPQFVHARATTNALLDEQKLAMKANLAVMRCLDVQVKAL
jgi:hypothetical protein